MAIVKFDFYTIKTSPNSSLSFKDALDGILAMSPEEKSIEIEGVPCFMTETITIRAATGYIFNKLRMVGLPPKMKLDGTRTDIELDEDEGLGEEVAIAHSADLNVVAVQRNRNSLSANNIVKIINTLYPEVHVVFEPILRTDALERFSRCNILKKVHIKLAGTSDFSFLRDSTLSANEKVSIQGVLTEPFVDLTFSVGRQRGSLTDKIKNLATFFTNYYRDGGDRTVLSVEISGKEDDATATSVIDLLEDRLIHTDSVESIGRTVDTNHLLRVACNALLANHEELSAYV